MIETLLPESQDVRRLFFTLVSAQVVFVANGEAQMITKQSFSSSPDSTLPAKYLLQMQNSLGHQVKLQVEQAGGTFEKLVDITINTIVPLGHMTHDEFWAGMNSANPEVEPLPEAAPQATAAVVTSIRRKPKKTT